MSPQF